MNLLHLIDRYKEVFIGACEPCGCVVAGEGRGRGGPTKTDVIWKKACVNFCFKIPFINGGEYVDTILETYELTSCWAFI